MSIRLVPLAIASLALSAAAFSAQAQVSVQKECGAEYQAAKAAGSLNGQSWGEFLHACRERHSGGAAAAAPAAAEAPAPTPAAASPAAPAEPMAAPAEAHVSVQKQCGAEYQAAKTAGSLNGETWQQFLQACRTRHAAPAAAAPAAPAPAPVAAPSPPPPAPVAEPAKPAAAPPAPAPSSPVTTKSGKPVSPGTQAFIDREKACGAEWRAKKAALLKANPKATWPAYLSECNKRLKAQGR
jgi:hypothetical protein